MKFGPQYSWSEKPEIDCSVVNGGWAERKNPSFWTIAWNITSSVAVGQNACLQYRGTGK